MKKSILMIVLIQLLSLTNLLAKGKINESDSVKVISEFRNFYQYQNFYLTGQPTLEALRWLKSQDVTTVINLRSERENNDFTSTAFNEEEMVQELGLEYHSLPVRGKADYTNEKLKAFIQLIGKADKVLVHCAGAGRVRMFFMAYLVEQKGYSLNEAIQVGEQLNYSFSLGTLINKEVEMKIND